MPRLLIRCPKTGKFLSTGVTMDEASYKSPNAVIINVQVACPHCGQIHTWSKQDTLLEMDKLKKW